MNQCTFSSCYFTLVEVPHAELLSLPGQLCRSSPTPARGGDWAQPSLPRGSTKEVGPVWPQIISGAKFIATVLTAHCSLHSLLCATALGCSQITTLLCTLLINLHGQLRPTSSTKSRCSWYLSSPGQHLPPQLEFAASCVCVQPDSPQ